MSKGKKQGLQILILCGIIVLLGIGYVFAGQKKEKGKNTDEKEIVLHKVKEKDIVKLSYSNGKGNMTLWKKKGKWMLQGDKSFPVDQDRVATMVSDMASVSATKIVTKNCNDLEQYQLDSPQLSVEITDKKGKTYCISYGLESAEAGGCYGYTDDKKVIYVVPSNVTTDFSYSKKQMMALPDIPDIQEEYVTSYKVQKKEKTTFQAVYDPKNAKWKDIYGWDITAPYSQTVAGDQDSLVSNFSGVTGLDYTEGVVYKATAKDLKKYGLKNPKYTVSMKYYTVDSGKEKEDTTKIAEKDKTYHTFQLYVGNMDDAQENYYVMDGEHDGIYLVAADTMDSIVKPDPFQCVYTNLCPTNIDNLKKVVFEYQKKKYTITVEKKEKKSSGLQKETTSIFRMNGKKVKKTKVQSSYEALGELTYSGVISKKQKITANTPVASLTITEKSKTYHVTFLPYDGINFYRVQVNGVCQFVTDKQGVDTALKNLTEIK